MSIVALVAILGLNRVTGEVRRPEVQAAITKPLEAAGFLRCCGAGHEMSPNPQ